MDSRLEDFRKLSSGKERMWLALEQRRPHPHRMVIRKAFRKRLRPQRWAKPIIRLQELEYQGALSVQRTPQQAFKLPQPA